MSRIVWGPLTWFALAGLYLLLSGNVSLVEAAAAAVCATCATSLALAVSRFTDRRIELRAPVGAILRPVAALLPEFLTVARELALVAVRGGGRHRGDFQSQPFDAGGDDPRSAARREALTIIGVSMTPRSFVVRGERADALLVHGLPPKSPSSDIAWPA